MKYRITPFNVIAVGINIYLIGDYALQSAPDAGGLGLLLVFYGVGAGFVLLVLDVVIQLIAREYKRIIPIEMLIIAGVVFWAASTLRAKTLLIPDDFGEGNLTIIYGKEGADQLPLGFFTWSYEVKIPESGVLLTSTKFEDDLPETKVKTYSKIDLDEQNEGLTSGCMYESEMNCGGKIYKYRNWVIQKKGCEYSSQKADSARVILQNKYCK